MGATGMKVSVLGFGGAEIGFRAVPQDEVNPLLNSALDAGLNVIDTAACYADSEEMIGRTIGHRRSEYLPVHQVRPRFRTRGRETGIPI